MVFIKFRHRRRRTRRPFPAPLVPGPGEIYARRGKATKLKNKTGARKMEINNGGCVCGKFPSAADRESRRRRTGRKLSVYSRYLHPSDMKVSGGIKRHVEDTFSSHVTLFSLFFTPQDTTARLTHLRLYSITNDF